MDLGRKSRDQPRKDKLKANKQRNSTHFETTSQPRRMNLIASPREIEYVESSHPSVLARGTGTKSWTRSQQSSQPRSKRESGDRRPCTPVPSLIGSDTMSPPSISTISPTTPVFDVALSRPSMTRPSHNRQPTPLQFDKPQNENRSPPKPRTTQYDIDPASTYQPRRMIPVNPSIQATSQRTHPTSTEETSFIDWDDDSSRLQRMKQSLTFARPHRPNKPTSTQPKNLDNQLNAIPRAPSSPKSPQSTSPTYTYTPQPRSPTYDTTQQRPQPICVPAASGQTRYLPSNISPHSTQTPHLYQYPYSQARHPEPTRAAPQPISTSTTITTHYPPPPRQDLTRPSHTYTYTPQSRPTRSPTYPGQNQDQPQPSTYTSTRYEQAQNTINENETLKPNRFHKLVRGVVNRVSMRDMRKEAAGGAGSGARK